MNNNYLKIKTLFGVDSSLLFFIFCFLSCDDKEKKIKEKRDLCILISKESSGEETYYNVYNQANDSIRIWIQNNLRDYSMQKYSLEWQLDSVICFNQKADKCRMCIMNRQSETVSNSINYFYGIQIKKCWVFFSGPTLYTFSEYYGLPPKIPLSFEKMQQIATSNIYQGYLKRGKKKGEWEIREAFFADIISVAWGPPGNTQEQWDSTYLSIIRQNWLSKDTTDYEND